MKRFSPPLIVAMLALFFALGGGAMAATHYLITSTRQISPKVLKKLEKAGPRGKTGATGKTGAAGAQGTAGISPTASIAAVDGSVAIVAAGDGEVGDSLATCPTGSVVVGGGWLGESPDPPVDATVADDGPDGTGAWEVVLVNYAEIPADFYAVADCEGGTETAAISRPAATTGDARAALERAGS